MPSDATFESLERAVRQPAVLDMELESAARIDELYGLTGVEIKLVEGGQ